MSREHDLGWDHGRVPFSKPCVYVAEALGHMPFGLSQRHIT